MTIRQNLPAAEYHARPELNFSRLKRFNRSPLHFQAAPKETSAGFALGSAAHTAILEPRLWEGRYQKQVAKRRDLRSNDWREELTGATNRGLEIIHPDDWEAAQEIARIVGEKPAARVLLHAADKEVTVITTLRGVPVRCRLDIARPSEPIEGRPGRVTVGCLGDVKTCQDLNRFASDVERYLYLAQAAFYVDCWHAETGDRLPWKWLAVEAKAPHDSAVIAASESDLEAGRVLYESWMDRHAQCLTERAWPGYDGGADEVQLMRPRWATRAGEADEAVGGYEMEVSDGAEGDEQNGSEA